MKTRIDAITALVWIPLVLGLVVGLVQREAGAHEAEQGCVPARFTALEDTYMGLMTMAR